MNGKHHREKKQKLVLKLPKSDTNSTSFNSTGEESNGEEEKNTGSNEKKRKIVVSENEKGDRKSATGTNPTSYVQDSGSSTPLPDKKLLLFILDRLQKKDTYSVFSEPVDLNELPDYLDVIEHPMDFPYLSGQSHGSRNEAYVSTGNRFEKNDETAGSILKGQHIKKHLALDENSRNTYKQFHPSAGGRVPSVLNTFDAERKQLVAAGLLTEHGYARSIARFAANIGPFSWTIEVKRIEKSLARGVKFGPGWVGENEIPPHKPLFSSPPAKSAGTTTTKALLRS